ncbi:MAG: amidohydrolase family protein [Actinomycetota bacterium]|nr:amidohydrolase family protein [Actinomycetota bacterium]
MLDVVLHGGWVVDGTGAPPWRADLGVHGDRIAAIGALSDVSAASRVDVSNRYLMAGFVDTHVHADASAATEEVQTAALRQGVTTVLIGQDGLSFAPASKDTITQISRYFGPVNGPCPPELAGGCSVADLLAHYDRAGALNVGYLAPAGTIRAEVMGYRAGRPDRGELRAMRTLVEQALSDGALGLSTGLEYVPGRFADAGEIAELCAPVAAAGRVYVSHMRGYEADAWLGLQEVSDIARRSRIAVHVSHLHGPANMITQLISQARGEGLDLTFDSYPYLRGSSILAMVALPPYVQQAGPKDTASRLSDFNERERLLQEWFPQIADVLERITLSYVGAEEYSWAEGLSLHEAAKRAYTSLGAFVCDLVTASDSGAGCVFSQPPTNTEDDVRTLLRHEAQMVGSDGILLGSCPHPRGWGAFARVLGRHTRELGDLTWGQAALHLAGHPARRFGLTGRGLLRVGSFADVCVVDPAAVTDQATYTASRVPATGISDVLVNGQFVLRNAALTGAKPGRGLRFGEESTST